MLLNQKINRYIYYISYVYVFRNLSIIYVKYNICLHKYYIVYFKTTDDIVLLSNVAERWVMWPLLDNIV